MALMNSSDQDFIKHREIEFCLLHPDARQAQTAMLLLSDVKGVSHLSLADEKRLQVSYHIQHVTLQMIEEALTEAGFHLENSLLIKLKRALYYYTEEVQRENLGCSRGSRNCTDKIFVSRYQKLRHGCRDERPEYWRKYL
jgi:hypothetical protein